MASAIENSILRAIAKGNGDDPDFRVLVYEAAERAIVRSETDGKTSASESDERRRELIAAVETIEADYPPVERGGDSSGEPQSGADSIPGAVSDVPDIALRETTTGASVSDGASADGQQRQEPLADGEVAAERPKAEIDDEPDVAFDARRDDKSDFETANAADPWMPGVPRKASGASRYPKRIVAIVIVALLAFLVIIGAYLILPFLLPNLFASAPQAQSSVDPIAAAIRSASGDGETPVAGDGWTIAFAADGIEGVEAGPRGTVSAVTGPGERAAVRIAATGPANDADPAVVAALIVAAGTVTELAGRTVRGELTVGSPDGTAREFTVSCHIADQSICGRQRFSTKIDSQSFVFDMDIPSAATGEARLSVDPSLGSGASDINVFRLRLKSA